MSLQVPFISDHLEIIKFVCRQFWVRLFGKQMDTLKTNHRGVYVLQDNNLSLLHPFLQNPKSLRTPLMTILVR